ncbi:MAG: PepSY domain-containing protein [Micrococcales bacterium]|nr:PepSY domain-containing protein [Micrococcales bacterium]
MTEVLTPARERNRSSGLYRAFWRWHFYASFLVIPVMLILSVTGLIYMFRFTIDPLMHQGVITVQSEQGVVQPLSVQQEAVEEAFPDYPVLSALQPSGDRATLFTVADGEETVRSVYVDPYTAQVTGDLNPESLLSNMAVRLHGELMTGKIGDAVIELAVCWAIVMTITGYYLFVRNWRKRRTRAPIRRRHALVGAIAGVGILFLIVSGLPWTGLWGEKVQEIAAPRGMSLWGEDPGATSTLKESIEGASSSSAPAGWAIGETEVPAAPVTTTVVAQPPGKPAATSASTPPSTPPTRPASPVPTPWSTRTAKKESGR